MKFARATPLSAMQMYAPAVSLEALMRKTARFSSELIDGSVVPSYSQNPA